MNRFVLLSSDNPTPPLTKTKENDSCKVIVSRKTYFLINVKTYADTCGLSRIFQCGNTFGDFAGTTTWIRSTLLCILR